MGTGAVALFLWAIRDGEFDDLETPAIRVLIDDQRVGD
jgi:cbb3-type cytochrome oxidase maturation protein